MSRAEEGEALEFVPKGSAEGARAERPAGGRRGDARPRQRRPPARAEGAEGRERFGFQYPEGWREEARRGVTLESKVPENPRADELLPKPDPQRLRQDLDRLEGQLDRLFHTLDRKRAEKKAHLDRLRGKNKGIVEQLKEKRELKKEKFMRPLGELKERRQKLVAEIEGVAEQIAQLRSKAAGRTLSKEELTRLLRKETLEYESRQYTATEEVKVLQSISRLKEALSLVAPADELRKKKEALRAELDRLGAQSSELSAQMKPLSAEIQALSDALGQQRSAEEKEGAEASRPKDEVTLKLDGEVKLLHEQRLELMEARRKLNEAYKKNLHAHQEQRFEVQRLEEMRKHQAYLRGVERRKKEQEEYEQHKAEERQREKEKLKFKYQAEIALCDRLEHFLAEVLRSKRPAEVAPEQPAESPVAPTAPVDEGMKVFVGKKGLFKDEEPARPVKKPGKRKQQSDSRSQKLFEDYTVVMLFDELNLLAPNTVPEAEATLAQLQEKKAQFHKMREEEILQAEKNEKALATEGVEEAGESAAADEANKPEDETSEPARPEEAPVRLAESDFPEL